MGRGFKLGDSQLNKAGGKSAALVQRVTIVDANGQPVPATVEAADASLPDWDGSLYFRKGILTQDGDIIMRKAGALTRLPVGTVGQVLTVANGVPSWATGGGGGMANPMTTTGDMIFSNPGTTPVRLPIGTAGQVLTVVGGLPAWAAGGGGGATGTDASYAAALLAKGPQGYWKFGEAASPFSDSSGYRAGGNNATANGGITTSATGGPYGASSPYISFNGTTGWLSFVAAPGDGGFPGDTIVLWIKPTAATFVGLIDTQPGAGGVHRNYPAGFFERQAGVSAAIPNLSTVNWTHLAFSISRQSGVLNIYVNGVVQTGFPLLFDSAAYPFNATWVIGNINGGGAGWLSAKIAHFAYFNRQLQAAEVLALFNS